MCILLGGGDHELYSLFLHRFSRQKASDEEKADGDTIGTASFMTITV